ncbi:MAG: aldehyde dehydrogenase family protein [Gemmatimonadetes bacterium]|nr:aldehyde dehydrogenase family protein [Gemmatimonadota bacterium]
MEDEPAVRRLTSRVLERRGYRVLTAAHGREALRLWQEAQGQVQVLVTDIVMPGGLTGQELATRLQGEAPGLKVILMSGYAVDATGRPLQIPEGQVFMQKPISPRELLEAVARALEGLGRPPPFPNPRAAVYSGPTPTRHAWHAHAHCRPILLDGQWITPKSKVLRPILNPATTEQVGLAADCAREDVHFACEAAARAQPGWWAIPGVEKAKLLREVGARIRAADKELATLMARETGKLLIEAIDEIEWVAAPHEYYAECGRRSFGNSIPPVAPHQVNFTIKEPYGVVAAIVPFNFPLLLLAWKLAPALAAGNTVVAKPPHQETSLATLLMARCLAALPPPGGERHHRRPRDGRTAGAGPHGGPHRLHRPSRPAGAWRRRRAASSRR